jgi:hypothetical protein
MRKQVTFIINIQIVLELYDHQVFVGVKSLRCQVFYNAAN